MTGTYAFSGGQLPNAGMQQQPQGGLVQPQGQEQSPVQAQGQDQGQFQGQLQQGAVQGQYKATTNAPMKFTTIPTPSTGLKIVEPSARRSRFMDERTMVDRQQASPYKQQAKQLGGQQGVGWREQGEATTKVVPLRGDHDDQSEHVGIDTGRQDQRQTQDGHQPEWQGQPGQADNHLAPQPPAPVGVKQGALPQVEEAETRPDQLSQSEKARQDKFREYIGEKQKRLDRPQGQGHAPGEGRGQAPLQYGEPGRFGHYPDQHGQAPGQREGPEYRPPSGKHANYT